MGLPCVLISCALVFMTSGASSRGVQKSGPVLTLKSSLPMIRQDSEDDLVLECQINNTNTEVKTMLLIGLVYRDGNQSHFLASQGPGNTQVRQDDGRTTAQGHFFSCMSEGPTYLSVTINTASEQDRGTYDCILTFLDRQFIAQQTTNSFTIDTEGSTIEELEQLRNQIEQWQASHKEQQQRALTEGFPCETLEGPGRTVTLLKFDGGSQNVLASCDLDTDGGKWTVIQRRQDGSVDFNRTWEDYKMGFGSIDGEFWFGLENIRELVKSEDYQLRIDMRNSASESRFAVYQNFSIADESDSYRLSLGPYLYSSTAGNSFSYHDNERFETYDNESSNSYGGCATRYSGGFWYKSRSYYSTRYSCRYVNANGMYGLNNDIGIFWNGFEGKALTFFQMKVRPQ